MSTRNPSQISRSQTSNKGSFELIDILNGNMVLLLRHTTHHLAKNIGNNVIINLKDLLMSVRYLSIVRSDC